MTSLRAGAPVGLLRSGALSVTQEALWRIHVANPESDALNLAYQLRVDGPLRLDALEDAFAEAHQRHEVLRTTYEECDGRPVAQIWSYDRDRIAIRQRTVDDGYEAVRLALADSRQPFDIARELPARMTVTSETSQRHLVALACHHVAADGWSLGLLCRELSRAYAARVRGEAAIVPPAPQCADHARWQRERLPAARPESPEWSVDLDVSAAFVCSEPGPQAHHRHVALFPRELNGALMEFARRERVSMFAVLLAAYQVVLARWRRTDDVVVGTLAANRPTKASTGVLGAHYTCVVTRCRVDTGTTLGEVLIDTARCLLAALEEAPLPYSVVAPAIEPVDRGVVVPAGMLMFDRYPAEELRLTGATVTGLYCDGGEARTPLDGGGPIADISAIQGADLTFFIRQSGSQLTLSAFHRVTRGDAGEVVRLMADYFAALATLVDAPHTTVAALGETFAPPERLRRDESDLRTQLRPVTEMSPVEALSPIV